MYKRIIYKSVMVLTLVLSCSCNKYLTLYPQDGTIRQEFWKNKEQVQSAVYGVYSSMLGGSPKSLVETMFLWGELRGDNVILGNIYTVDDANVLSVNILPTNGDVQWAAVYATINYCNTVLDFAPGVLALDPTFTQTQLDAYRSEMLTIRSLMYFYLVRSFGDVPLKLTSTSSDSDLAQLTKTPQATILAQIVSDLNTAESKAVFTYGNQAMDKGRITKFAVNTLQADVYLWMENYSACIAACDKVINSGRFGLVAGDASFFTTLYVNGNSNESIFELQFDSQVQNPLFTILGGTKTAPRLLANPNILFNTFTQDSTDPTNFDNRAANVSINPNSSLIWKYIGASKTSARAATNTIPPHWFVYRYADVLLLKAEACAWIGGRGQDALDLIKTIRDRAHALPATLEFPDPNDSYGVSTYVFDERDREFAFEGKRWFDILRNAKRNNFAHSEILVNIAALNAAPNLQQSIVAKYQDHNAYYFPIYYTEIQNDPNLIQNSFYK